MALRYQRFLGPAAALDPGQFTVAEGRAQTSCPLCDHISTLPKTHTVDAAGVVTPIYACSRCPFREWIVLGDIGEAVV